jgi:hypothetical protein
LYCFFVIEHGRRKILHFNVTGHATAEWVVRQLREAFPEAASYRYVILDRDAKFDACVISFLQGTGLTLKRTSVRSPWQNGIAERWVGSCRRELLDHVIPLNEQHLCRLVRDYRAYYQEDRIHDALGKDTPHLPVEKKPVPEATVISSEAWVVSIIATHGAKQRRRARFGPSAIVNSSGRSGALGLQVCLSGHTAQNPKGREASGLGFATCLLGIRSYETAAFF